MLVISALIHVQVAQQLRAQTILGQHALYYLTEQTVGALLHERARRVLNLSTGITGVSQINTIVPLVTRQNDFVCVDDNYVITTVNVRSVIGFVFAAQELRYLRTTHSLFTVALFAEMVLKLKVSTA